jgi:heterogeneous nuclear ribonucleoprotein F/H
MLRLFSNYSLLEILLLLLGQQHIKEQDSRPQLRSGSMTDEGLGNDPMPSGDAAAVSLWGQPSASSSSLQALAAQSAYSEGMARGTASIALSGRGLGGPGRGGLHAPIPKRTGGGIQVGDHTGFLRMRGLPFAASKEEILNFFEGYNAVPESVVLTYRNDGRATGEAYIGFSSPEDSKRAMELHRRTMGARYIELFISNKEEQGRALARFGNR